MKAYSEIKKELEARKDRSAWGRGVNAYALELLEELRERAAYEGRDPKPGTLPKDFAPRPNSRKPATANADRTAGKNG